MGYGIVVGVDHATLASVDAVTAGTDLLTVIGADPYPMDYAPKTAGAFCGVAAFHSSLPGVVAFEPTDGEAGASHAFGEAPLDQAFDDTAGVVVNARPDYRNVGSWTQPPPSTASLWVFYADHLRNNPVAEELGTYLQTTLVTDPPVFVEPDRATQLTCAVRLQGWASGVSVWSGNRLTLMSELPVASRDRFERIGARSGR